MNDPWTKRPPSAAGYYWLRRHGRAQPEMAKAISGVMGVRMYVSTIDAIWQLQSVEEFCRLSPRARWLGPLQQGDTRNASELVEIIREAQRILTDQISNALSDHEALNQLHALLDGPRTRKAMPD